MTEEDRAPIRKDFFLRIFRGCEKALPEFFKEADFDDNDADCLADLYFAISDDYKEWRLKAPDHRTNDYKKAGITVAAVMAMRPISPRIAEENLQSLYMNQIFAIACATGILNRPISSMPEEDRTQFYLWLDNLRFPSTEPFLRAALSTEAHAPNRVVLAHVEISQIDMIIQKIKDRCILHDIELQLHDHSTDP